MDFENPIFREQTDGNSYKKFTKEKVLPFWVKACFIVLAILTILSIALSIAAFCLVNQKPEALPQSPTFSKRIGTNGISGRNKSFTKLTGNVTNLAMKLQNLKKDMDAVYKELSSLNSKIDQFKTSQDNRNKNFTNNDQLLKSQQSIISKKLDNLLDQMNKFNKSITSIGTDTVNTGGRNTSEPGLNQLRSNLIRMLQQQNDSIKQLQFEATSHDNDFVVLQNKVSNISSSLESFQTFVNASLKDVLGAASTLSWFSPLNGFQYSLTPTPQTWQGAGEACAALNATLVVHGAKNFNLRKRIAINTGVSGFTWIGLHRVRGVWEWSDGTNATRGEVHWHPNEPNALGNEECVNIFGPGTNDQFTSNDDGCWRSLYGLCERQV